MKKQLRLVGRIFVLLAAAILIFDAKTASKGVQEGIELCLKSVIPALFPFVCLSGMLNRVIIGNSPVIMRSLGRLLRIPSGTEGILLAGLLGGYPIGAKMIIDAQKNGSISDNCSRRMLGFCNQAGPAFLFGMLGPIVGSQKYIWMIWGLQILSAIITGILLPGKSEDYRVTNNHAAHSYNTSIRSTILTMSTICSWVIIFRVILAFISRWFIWMLPQHMQVLLAGILELSNGCAALSQIQSLWEIMIISGIILSFGGICVLMQTITVCGDLGTGLYFPGKILQASINCLLSVLLAVLTFLDADIAVIVPLAAVSLISLSGVLLYLHRKKVVAFLRRILYNNGSYSYERG
ncbi:MAG: hypothetical protein IJB47_02020 [Oscillospiraceae bacterium]|nr:hypothetical protein [Oscillospiraceae bacterium]